MIDIILNGALGRMGKEITRIVLDENKFRIVGCLEYANHPAIGADIGEFIGFGKTGVIISDSINNLNANPSKSVIIDFSTPKSTMELLKSCEKRGNQIVIGTTGLTEKELNQINTFAKENAILYSPNMSLGINFLFYLTQITAEKLCNDFDIEIIEAHHRFKNDSPSGTAKRLGEITSKALDANYSNDVKHGRFGIIGERTRKEIGMHSIRGGDIVGDHKVIFAGLGERLELKHIASSRSTFAQGALKAAKWLNSRKSGLYSMRDLLGF